MCNAGWDGLSGLGASSVPHRVLLFLLGSPSHHGTFKRWARSRAAAAGEEIRPYPPVVTF